MYGYMRDGISIATQGQAQLIFISESRNSIKNKTKYNNVQMLDVYTENIRKKMFQFKAFLAKITK